MNAKVDIGNSRLDTVKIIVALLSVISATAAFYLFPEQSLLFRVFIILAAFAIAVVISLQTEKGRQIWDFFKDAQTEVRKVVWPAREETLQTTLIVVLMVIFIALFLWLLDLFLGWSIGMVIGGKG